jgi:hypothetical protein
MPAPTRRLVLAGVLTLASLGAPAARAGDPPAAPAALPRGLAIGDVAPDLAGTTLDGSPFVLSKARTIPAAEALAAVLAAARAAGAKDALAATDGLEKVPGLKGDAGIDAARCAALATAAGHAYGLIADEKAVAALKTIGDVAAWIETAASAPIVFLCWSPSCPTSKLYEERLVAAIAANHARLYVLASNGTDTPDAARAYVTQKELPFLVVSDHDQRITDVLGGRRTPHAFVLDAKNALRYAGAIDSDAAMTEPEERRIPYLARALAQLNEGGPIDILLTTPVG